MHRKPSKIRRALRRVAALLTLAGMAAGLAVTGTGVVRAASHGDHVTADQRMCVAFDRWSNRDGRGDAIVWARYLPGTDGYLYRDGLTFAWAIKTHAPHPVLRNAFEYVWSDCNPDA